MKKIRMAIVGAGIWGETHASIYNEHVLAEVAAICDTDKEKAQRVADKHGIKEVYTDYHELFQKADFDAAAIVTPDHLHADIAIACANSKRHMLIEKPLATSKEDVFRMVEAIRRNHVRAMVDLHNRWSPPFNTAKQEISSGKLGRPVSAYYRLNDIRWVATDMLPWASKSSILWFLGSHSLDTLRWLMDDEPQEVYSVSHEGILKAEGVDTTDMYMTTIRFRKGGIAQMENGWITPNANSCINDIKFSILCEKGKIDIDASSHNMIQMTTDEKVTTPDILVRNNVFSKCRGFAYESIRSFIDQLSSGEEFHVSLEDAANTSLAILSIFESAETGLPVKVETL
jgi:predicted dehydrogenase